MIYRAIGLMSGSSLDGLDIAFVTFEEIRGQWDFTINNAETIEYTHRWKERLSQAAQMNAFDFVQLDNDLGRYFGEQVNQFIEKYQLHHQIQMIASHGHTIFHQPASFVTTQIGNGAQIAAITGINVVDNLRALDVALGGQGAPIVPIGEKYLYKDHTSFLNLGGIANISFHSENNTLAFDICVANQALNYFAQQLDLDFDKDGILASKGELNAELLEQLNELNYYTQDAPKSLSNQFFKEAILPLINAFHLDIEDVLRTYTEHIVTQISNTITHHIQAPQQIMVTGGGAFNTFLLKSLQDCLAKISIELIIPERNTVAYKEALIMAFLGVLRWREENTVLPNSTGALRPSIGGAVWIGQEY